ncbi:FAD-binding dehydrogenase [Actinomycetospora sp. NBRC 106378]|uniref:FAD-binding dehydrogenase n=1 Tax=Actinomycetospora sp. NBRC 106378 TaxID=3032208 RepID=UPI0024A6041C|nr:FAD-binding dehydrogenase [Actinomycetospora sp. NBRC 106378]GLZ53078.1 FAD-binding dehydrogenase [Actinomycetospora sp. NBRC 106378]
MSTPDVVVVGAGLSGLVATAELADAGRRVVLVDQEPEASLGGQAWWSFGGLFLVDSPEQRRLRIRDSVELAWSDWQGSAQFDATGDEQGRAWARAYVEWAAGEKRSWLRAQGVRFFPVVGWAERGSGSPTGHGNSVPRFHITWGTGPGILEPFLRRVRAAVADGRVELRHRHRVDRVVTTAGVVTGVSGAVLEPSDVSRGQSSSRVETGTFEIAAGAVVVTSGGIGGDHEAVRKYWPARLGTPPEHMISGVPAHVDGRMIGITEAAGGAVVHRDRMWHYTEGIVNHSPVWPLHGIRILPGPSSMWFDATGRRLPAPLFPGHDTLATLAHIRCTGHDHTWFVTTQRILEKEFALSGSEQNPDLTGRDIRLTLQRGRPGPTGPVGEFQRRGADFVAAGSLAELVDRMNALTPEPLLRLEDVEREVVARDRDLDNPYGKDAQLAAVRNARGYLGDRLVRVAAPHRLLDPEAGPLVAVKLHVLTRKTLGGLHTDLAGRVLGVDGVPVPGLYAAGEAAGFGGGGVHGYNSLEGTFLGGCLFSGRTVGRALAG